MTPRDTSDAARALGSVTSERKARAVRANGRRGGRPRLPLEQIPCTCSPGSRISDCRRCRIERQRRRSANKQII